MLGAMNTSICVALGLLVACALAQRKPPNYSLDDMPDTNFNCRDKILGGYYADPETDCQMFHVCVKVPGVGIQDYRFLCPNDTSFDQENQICANWYDIDCEAATLYYSDNFDLYRIGYSPSVSPILGGSSATPIPLGPSSVRPPVRAPAAPARPRPRNNNNRPTDEEEDYFLQRSETGDRRLQQKDLLRGSSSGNYFKGKDVEYDDDGETTYEDRKTPAFQRGVNNNKKKVAVRKLVKRPNEATTFQNYPRAPSTTVVPTTKYTQSSRDYYNRDYNNVNTRDYQRQSSFSDSSSTAANYYTPTTAAPSTVRVNSYQPRYNTIQRNSPQAFTTPTTTTTQTPSSNNYYNNYQRNPTRYNNNYTTTTNYPASSNDYNYNSNTPQKSYTNNDYPKSSNTYYSPTTFAPTTYDAYSANSNDQKRISNTYSQRNNEYYNTKSTTTTVAPTQSYNNNNNYYQSSTANDNYNNNNNYNNNYNNNNNYNYQKTNSADYSAADENVEGESLKTAPSNNYRPSSFNTFQNNYNKPTTAVTKNNTASSAGTATYNTRQYSQPTTQRITSSTTRQPQTQRSYQQANGNTGAVSVTTAKSHVTGGKKGDAAYDYAYYDDSNSEYEGFDPISDHHFGKGGESLKVARSAK